MTGPRRVLVVAGLLEVDGRDGPSGEWRTVPRGAGRGGAGSLVRATLTSVAVLAGGFDTVGPSSGVRVVGSTTLAAATGSGAGSEGGSGSAAEGGATRSSGESDGRAVGVGSSSVALEGA